MHVSCNKCLVDPAGLCCLLHIQSNTFLIYLFKAKVPASNIYHTNLLEKKTSKRKYDSNNHLVGNLRDDYNLQRESRYLYENQNNREIK